MKLNYRNLSYVSKMTSTLMQRTWIIGQFRGVVYRLSRPVIVQKQSSKVLKYRGIPYHSMHSTTIRIESEQNLTHSSVFVNNQPSQPSQPHIDS
jgi:hypothetical protein